MTLDAPLAAATAIHRTRQRDTSCASGDETYQLQLAHVLLDGGYDGVATLSEVLESGDLGLGTFDRLDGELVIVDGEPWRVDWHGQATLMPLDTRTPFAVVSALENATELRLRDCSREQLADVIEEAVDSPLSVLSIRVEGTFDYVHVRSVPPQDPPYRPYSEVCQTDEVSWKHRPFHGVFVGFRFPDLEPGATIPGLHLHGLDRLRTTGGHNYDLHIRDAKLSVGVSRDVMMHLPDKSMLDMLEAPADMRAAQRALLRNGALTIDALAEALSIPSQEAARRVEWLADRGFVEERPEATPGTPTSPTREPRWAMTLTASGRALPSALDDILSKLDT